MPEGLIDALPNDLEKALSQVLAHGEEVTVKLKGAFKEALVCTDRRVIIVKKGFMTGQTFGSDAFQQPYRSIAGVQVKFNIMSGYVEVNSGGMQNVSKSYWAQSGSADPSKAPNCVSLNSKQQAERFRQAASYILERIDGAHAPQPASAETSAAPTEQEAVLASITRLGELRDAGVLTEEEFSTKKAELLARL